MNRSQRETLGGLHDARSELIPQEKVWQLPFTIDLVRLATSIILAAEAVKIEAPMDKVTEFLIAGYEDGLKAGGRPILLEEEDCHELLAFVCAVKEDPAVFWARKLDDNENPEIDAKELPSWLEDIFGSAFPLGGKRAYRREKRPGGLGSLGRRRYIAVLKKGRDQYIAGEAKALVPSALSWLQKRPAAKSLTATLFQRAVRSPDPWLQVHDRWLVRQLAPDAVKIELPSSQEDSRLVFAPALIRAMGFESANIHLGSKSPSDLQTAMDRLRRDLGGDWLITATGRMAKVTRQDHME